MYLTEYTALKIGIVGSVFLLVILLEHAWPFYKGRTRVVWHDIKNLLLSGVNVGIMTYGFAALTVLAVESSFASYGLLPRLNLLNWTSAIVAVVLFDLWMYWWHRANHVVPILWRFHKMHHSDVDMDTSTALRFHPIEMIISGSLRLGVVIVLGMNLWQIVLYELIMMPVILFHHSNVVFPEWIDRWYRILLSSPRMHRVHHSDQERERNKNYTSIFSIWDRIFRTFHMRQNQKAIIQGVKGYQYDKWQSLWGMLKTPFSNEKY